MTFIDTTQHTVAEPATSSSMAAVGYTTAKQTARGIRLWTENATLLNNSGFYAGATYSTALTQGKVILKLDGQGRSKVSQCQRKGVVRPIIDLHSRALETCFTAGAIVRVDYTASMITFTQRKAQ